MALRGVDARLKAPTATSSDFVFVQYPTDGQLGRKHLQTKDVSRHLVKKKRFDKINRLRRSVQKTSPKESSSKDQSTDHKKQKSSSPDHQQWHLTLPSTLPSKSDQQILYAVQYGQDFLLDWSASLSPDKLPILMDRHANARRLYPSMVVDIGQGGVMLRQGHFQAAGAWLDRGFNRVREFVETISPTALIDLLLLISDIEVKADATSTFQDISPSKLANGIPQILRRYISHLCTTIWGKNHPLSVFAQTLAEVGYQKELVALVAGIIAERLTETFGRLSMVPIRARHLSTLLKRDLGMPLDQEFQEQIEDCEKLEPPNEMLLWSIRYAYWEYLGSQGKFSKVASMFSEMVPQILISSDFGALMACQSLSNMVMRDAASRTDPGDPIYKQTYDQVETLLLYMLDKWFDLFGEDSSQHIHVKLCVVEFYKTWGSKEWAMMALTHRMNYRHGTAQVLEISLSLMKIWHWQTVLSGSNRVVPFSKLVVDTFLPESQLNRLGAEPSSAQLYIYN